MFDIGWTEITFILIFAIIVIGPKELPRVLRTVGQWIGKAKSMTSEFRGHVDDMIRDTELDEVKKQIDTAASFDPNAALESTIDSDGEIKSAFDFSGDEVADLINQEADALDEEIKNETKGDQDLSDNESKVLDSTIALNEEYPSKESINNGKESKG